VIGAVPTVGTWIERRARTSPDRVALVHGTVRRSYAELAERVSRLAAGLYDLGVARGDRVAWLGDNHPAFLESFFAAARLGAVFAPVNHRLGSDVVAHLLDDYRVSLVIATLADSAVQIPADLHVVRVDGLPDGAFESLIDRSPTEPPAAEVSLDDVCLMPHTSGTTGAPKGVMLTHANVTWNAVNMLAVADLRNDDVTPALAPMFRTGGTGVNVLPVLFKGGTVVVPTRTSPDDLLALFERERVTVGFGNPDLLDALTRGRSWETADLSAVRFFITGGAPVPERLVLIYGARGVTFLQGYGLSEASPVVSVLDAENVARKGPSAGRPLLLVDIRTIRADGSGCDPFETGELLVKGPTVMAGYWGRDDATSAAVDEDGWLHTGDAAYVDDEGFVWIVDRMSDAFTVDGLVVYPGDIERCIAAHPSVRDVAAVAVDGSVRAYVVVDDTHEWSERALLDHCHARLDARAVPATVVFVQALPRTSVGKLDRGALPE
jgi:fatty-acyl-CoA synthase